jgi:hypothetical protein
VFLRALNSFIPLINIMNIDNLYIGIVIILLLVFIYILYDSWKRDVNDVDKVYNNSLEKIKTDILVDGSITHKQFYDVLKKNMQDIVKTESKSSRFHKLINSCYSGMLRGGFIGLVTNNPSGAVAASLVYGLISPITLYVKDEYMHDEKLPT